MARVFCFTLVGWIALLPFSVLGFHCKFSNDGCNSDSECCSDRCLQKHEGTNHRCTPSMLHQPCVFNYHCLEGLECCERTYNCCSPIWRDCMSSGDCCDSTHKCVYVKGFTYKRCLTASALASQLLPSAPLVLVSVLLSLSWTSILHTPSVIIFNRHPLTTRICEFLR